MTAPTDFIDVPSGALCGAIVTLTCKGPDEERSYFLEYDSQLDPDDYITGVTAVAGDTALAITNITVLGRRFRFTISGGTLNMKSGLEFTMTLKSGDIRTLICVVTIEAQGVLQTGTIPVIMGAQGARGTQIWFSDTDPTTSFVPPNGVAVNAGDSVYSSGSATFFVASFVSGSLTWVPYRIGEPTENFTITDGMMSEYYSRLPEVDAGTAGTVFANAGIITVSNRGVGSPAPSIGGITNAAMSIWFNLLPDTDPLTAGSWWNNAGVPTISSSGYGLVSEYSGTRILNSDWCYWVAGLPIAIEDGNVSSFFSNFWVQNSGIAFRIG